ncbi:MAG: hypothetical protein ACI33P_12240 [Lysinibacillus sp.]
MTYFIMMEMKRMKGGMGLVAYIVICSVIGLAIAGLFSLLYKSKEKKDEGFAFAYYELSYRRKMIRTMWMLPVVLIFLVVFSAAIEMNIIGKVFVWIFLLALFIAQLFYNYYKWKQEEQEDAEAS